MFFFCHSRESLRRELSRTRESILKLIRRPTPFYRDGAKDAKESKNKKLILV